MDLTLDRPGEHLFIRSVSADGILVADRLYPGPLVLSARDLVSDWSAQRLEDLGEPTLEPIFRLEPEVVLIGTGPVQRFPAPELLMCFYRRGVGVEFMSTPAACRTFNVLVSENRNVVAALLPPGAESRSEERLSP
ncbi:MAG TPA: MTH938/NDUFAF3 family protein [Xanthomonadales bacterium]|nr:MTH938/NDUFAF3 family protein [Xanthomonadales bacterium]